MLRREALVREKRKSYGLIRHGCNHLFIHFFVFAKAELS